MQGKRILVTGGAGFIGSHLCERLVEMGAEVLSLDNYFTGSVANHVEGVLEYRHASTFAIDMISHYEHMNLDYIFHLGEYSRVEQSFDEYKKVFKYNLDGTYNVLELAKKTGAKLIYAGSSTKFTEWDPGYIISPYAWSKKMNTELVVNYGDWFGIDYAITYFYNVYGGREISTGAYSTLIAKFKDKVENGQPLTVVKPGTQRRNFTYIDDIIDGLVLIGERGQGDEYGIGADRVYTVEEVAEMFGGPIEYLDERRGNRFSASVITDKTRALGWRPKVDLEDHIRQFTYQREFENAQ